MKLYKTKITVALLIGADNEEDAIGFTDLMMKELGGCYPLDISIKEVKTESQLPEGAKRDDALYNIEGKVGDLIVEKVKKHHKN